MPPFRQGRERVSTWVRQGPMLNRLKSRRGRVDMGAHIFEKGRSMPAKIMPVGTPGVRSMGRGHRTGSPRSPWAAGAGLFVATALALGASTLAARADFRVCNATQTLVGVAIGYRAKAGWITEGWWHVEGSTCKTLIEGPLSSRFYYLYAEDAERGGRWDGPINMCVAEKEFKIAGVTDCFARGFQRVGFQEYDTGEQASWMVQLTDEAEPEGAEAAGGTTTR